MTKKRTTLSSIVPFIIYFFWALTPGIKGGELLTLQCDEAR